MEGSYQNIDNTKRTKVVAIVVSLLVVAAVVAGVIVLVVLLTRAAPLAPSCANVCNTSNIKCFCTSNKNSTFQYVDTCSSPNVRSASFCTLLDGSTGCPNPSGYAASSTPCSLPFSNCTQDFAKYTKSKYPLANKDLNVDNSAELLVNKFFTDSAAGILYNNSEIYNAALANFTTSHSGFNADYVSEMFDSINLYFNYKWRENPQFKKVLPDDDPRLNLTIYDQSEARNKWRTEVVEYFLNQSEPVTEGRPIIYFMGGGGGSGKSTVYRILKDQGYFLTNSSVYVNADDIKDRDPVYQELVSLGDYRAADIVHADSSQLSKKLFADAIKQRKNIIFDGTMYKYNSTYHESILVAKEAGYDMYMIGVTVETHIAVSRAYWRTILSGRYVSSEVLINAHAGFSEGFGKYVDVLNETLLFYTGSNNGPAIKVFGAIDFGTTQTVYDEEQYENFLSKKAVVKNKNADNVKDLYEGLSSNFTYPIFSSGGCAVNSETLPRYGRVLAGVQNNYLTTGHVGAERGTCVCVKEELAPKAMSVPTTTASRSPDHEFSGIEFISALSGVEEILTNPENWRQQIYQNAVDRLG